MTDTFEQLIYTTPMDDNGSQYNRCTSSLKKLKYQLKCHIGKIGRLDWDGQGIKLATTSTESAINIFDFGSNINCNSNASNSRSSRVTYKQRGDLVIDRNHGYGVVSRLRHSKSVNTVNGDDSMLALAFGETIDIIKYGNHMTVNDNDTVDIDPATPPPFLSTFFVAPCF